AQPIIKQLDEILPASLKSKPPDQLSAIWANWVVQRDQEIRTRLIQGDEDSIVNFLLFGTSFTKQPRLTPAQVTELESEISSDRSLAADKARAAATLQSRLNDLIKGATTPGNNERLLFVRRV